MSPEEYLELLAERVRDERDDARQAAQWLCVNCGEHAEVCECGSYMPLLADGGEDTSGPKLEKDLNRKEGRRKST